MIEREAKDSKDEPRDSHPLKYKKETMAMV